MVITIRASLFLVCFEARSSEYGLQIAASEKRQAKACNLNCGLKLNRKVNCLTPALLE